MEQRSEPTTVEIVEVLRDIASDRAYNSYTLSLRCEQAADRLESQERDNTELTASRDRMTNAVAELTMKVGELTARAEQAEAERDAAINDTRSGGCTNCKHHTYFQTGKRNEKCKTCGTMRNYEWRGLPQEGAMK